jgi:hypothetical protein
LVVVVVVALAVDLGCLVSMVANLVEWELGMEKRK